MAKMFHHSPNVSKIHAIYLLSDNNIIPGESLLIIFFTKNKYKKETS